MSETKKNTLGVVALIISLVGTILSIFVIGIPLLVISLILGIIALRKTPRKSAIAAVIISGLQVIGLIVCVALLRKPVIQPSIQFVNDINKMSKNNPDLEKAFADPDFKEYYEYAITKAMLEPDRNNIIDKSSSRQTQAEVATRLALDIILQQTPIIYNQRKSGDTLPTNIIGEDYNPLANTSRKLTTFNGDAVNGDYTLDFTDTNVNIQLCNSVGGNYGIADDKIEGNFWMTDMACVDEEKMSLEGAFNLKDATFTIASTRMSENNNERLSITTTDDDVFVFSKIQNEIVNTITPDSASDLPTAYEIADEAPTHGLSEDEYEAFIREIQSLVE
ncbi:hypothetical protein AGMMS50249_2140 [candidate division SR1 bacterium]|nr:hypothetical protein AGMMS50249_2140 [candidate division SR1 bacterium]